MSHLIEKKAIISISHTIDQSVNKSINRLHNVKNLQVKSDIVSFSTVTKRRQLSLLCLDKAYQR